MISGDKILSVVAGVAIACILLVGNVPWYLATVAAVLTTGTFCAVLP